jgi:hypothetical protein
MNYNTINFVFGYFYCMFNTNKQHSIYMEKLNKIKEE